MWLRGFGFVGLDFSRTSSRLTDGLPMESLNDQVIDSDRKEVLRIAILILYPLMKISVLSIDGEIETSCRKFG